MADSLLWELRAVWRGVQDGQHTVSAVLQIVLHGWQDSALKNCDKGEARQQGGYPSTLQECWGISGSD